MNAYPGPFKCPDCGLWWSGFEHRCAPPAPAISVSGTVRCICSFDSHGRRVPSTAACLHSLVTYTTSAVRYGQLS